MSEPIYQNEYTHNLLKFIEDNISNELDTIYLSNIGYVSPPKLYRLFYNLTGHSVKEYIRKRRLSNALALIKLSDIDFTDIALQCGYSSHQALCRAVRQTLNLTPSEYKSNDTYYYFPPYDGKSLQSVMVSKDNILYKLCVLYYSPKLINIESTAVNTFLHVIPNYNGRIFGRNGKQRDNKFCYELYLTDSDGNYDILTSHGFEITNEYTCLTTKDYTNLNSTFAITTIPNNEQKINAAWNYLYTEWLQNSMFEYTNEPYYEEYIIKNNKPVKLKLYLPIKRRSEDTKITIIKNPKLNFITAKAKGYNAEDIASKTVIDFLTTHHPHIINTFNHLYLQKNANSCICGISVNPNQRFFIDENITSFTTKQNNYIQLESNITGNYEQYADILYSFAYNNGIDIDKTEIFAIYNTKESYINPNLKMYCPIKSL